MDATERVAVTAVWRLLEHGPVDGILNMAIDRAVQLGREEGSSPPTLRIYRWARPTVTIGRFQDGASVDRALCESLGVDVVRRFTGGRGVLHADEVTYSVIAGIDDGIPRGVAASYRHLCGALVAAYQELSIQASVTGRDRGVSGAAACYLQTTRADVAVGERKLSGSAQVWSGDTVLQHGSFVLHRNPELESRVFRLDASHAALLSESSRGLDELLGERPAPARVQTAIVNGFSRALGIRLVPGTLSAREAQMTRSLAGSLTSDTLLETRGRQL